MPVTGRAHWVCGLVFSSLFCAQPATDPSQVLLEARDRLHANLQRLPKYTCVQTVDRSYLEPHRPPFPPPSCDDISGAKKTGRYRLDLMATDRLRLDVAAANGHEIHSWAGASRFDSRRVDEIVHQGPIGTGPFGTFLNDIFENEGASYFYIGERTSGQARRFAYGYSIPRQSSHYMVGAENDWFTTAFDGEFEIDPDTLDLARLTVRTSALPPLTEMCEATTILDYDRVKIGSSEFLLPSASQLHILYTSALETDSRTTYSSCREYHGESTLHFDLSAGADAENSTAAARRDGPAIQAGLSLDLRLLNAIDTGTAAAGDLVSESLAAPALDPVTRQVLIPAGAVLRGRITRMEHRRRPSPHFLIVIQLESLETGNAIAPVHAVLDRSLEFAKVREKADRIPGRGVPIWMPPRSRASEGSFVFPTSKDRYLVPSGYASRWRTVQ